MKLFLFSLFLAAFLQTTLVGLNLSLIVILSRCVIISEKKNFYVAFFAGGLLGLLSSQNLGFWSLIFLMIVCMIHLLKKMSLTFNFKTIIPLAFLIVSITSFFEYLIFGQSLNFSKIFFESIFSLPAYLTFKFWEERFIVKPAIKLKIKN